MVGAGELTIKEMAPVRHSGELQYRCTYLAMYRWDTYEHLLTMVISDMIFHFFNNPRLGIFGLRTWHPPAPQAAPHPAIGDGIRNGNEVVQNTSGTPNTEMFAEVLSINPKECSNMAEMEIARTKQKRSKGGKIMYGWFEPIQKNHSFGWQTQF